MSNTADKERLIHELELIGKQIKNREKRKKMDTAAGIGGTATGVAEFLAALPRITLPEGLILVSAVSIGVIGFWRFWQNRSEEKTLRVEHKGLSRRLHAIPHIVSPPWGRTAR